MAGDFKQFMRRWGVRHRVSSAYFPRSNGRAEVAVKSAKRLLRSNVGPGGSLNNDRFLKAILQLRNTPDPDCSVSPAEILFGRPLRDNLSFTSRLHKFSDPQIRRTWQEAWKLKEVALRTRYAKSVEKLNLTAKHLAPLNLGDQCFVQNQHGRYPLKWERSGVVVEVLPHDRYVIKIDGSGHLTTRNRKFIRRFKPVTTVIERAPLREQQGSKSAPTIEPAEIGMEAEAEPPGPATHHSNSSTPTSESNTTHDSPAVKRLRPFNKPGLTEDIAPPIGRLRPRQVQ